MRTGDYYTIEVLTNNANLNTQRDRTDSPFIESARQLFLQRQQGYLLNRNEVENESGLEHHRMNLD